MIGAGGALAAQRCRDVSARTTLREHAARFADVRCRVRVRFVPTRAARHLQYMLERNTVERAAGELWHVVGHWIFERTDRAFGEGHANQARNPRLRDRPRAPLGTAGEAQEVLLVAERAPLPHQHRCGLGAVKQRCGAAGAAIVVVGGWKLQRFAAREAMWSLRAMDDPTRKDRRELAEVSCLIRAREDIEWPARPVLRHRRRSLPGSAPSRVFECPRRFRSPARAGRACGTLGPG